MTSRSFTRINETFTCGQCGENVRPAQKTCRNHCPFCLYSRHLDIKPGDRGSNCGGLMRPVGYYQNAKKGIMLRFSCERCGEVKDNKAALDDSIQTDDYDKILSLSSVTLI